MSGYVRKKSLLIGINYLGSQHQLSGCHQDVENMQEFLSYRGYNEGQGNQVIMIDSDDNDPYGPYFPNGHNILAAMDWLVSEPGTCCFLHYSGHGGQVADQEGNSSTGYDDTIVPVDFEQRGQISSTLLHQHLATRLAPRSTLFIIMDCCHSGSAVELPYVYRSDADGNVSMMDNLRMGAHLISEADDLIQGGFSFQRAGEAKDLLAGATDFFRGLKHMGEHQQPGLAGGDFAQQYGQERKVVTMFSGCRDDQTSADARIQGQSCGAMTWAFLQAMRREPNPTYIGVSQAC